MGVWERLPSCGWLVHVVISQSYIEVTQPLMLDFGTMAEKAQPPPRSLNQIFYMPRSIHLALEFRILVKICNLPLAYNIGPCYPNS